MKKSVWVVLGLMVVIVGVVLWFVQQQPAEQTPNTELTLSEPDLAVASTLPKNLAANTTKTADDEEDETFNPYQSEVFKAQVQQVADLFEEHSKYPVGSRPITNPDAVREPEPFEFNEVDLPFSDDLDSDDPIRISAATDTFQYFQGDIIRVRARISGAPSDTFIGVSGNLSGPGGDLPFPLVFQPADGTLTEFTSEFDSGLIPPGLTSPEMAAVIKVKVGTEDLLTTVSFRYDQPSAQIIGTLPSRVEGPNLVIPLQVSVGQTGYYFARGVLEDAQTGQPLIELQNEGPLTAGNGILNLNAHILALRVHQSEGPYTLRSVKLHRGAETGESFDVPASTLQKTFAIQGFPFSSYEDEEFVDELAQERLEFLRELGAVDEELVQEQLNLSADNLETEEQGNQQEEEVENNEN